MSNLEEELGKGLAEIIPEVYRDLAKPSVIKLGTAVGSILGVVLGPAGRLGEIGETNLIKLVNRLDAVSDIQEVQPELAGPILERLRYTRSEELSSLYIELFTKAASKAQASSAHPSFFEVITNLSIDEARVLEYAKRNLKEGSLGIPCLQIKATEENGGFDITREYFASLDSVVSFINLRGEDLLME